MRNPFEGPKLFSPSFVDALRAYAPELLELKAAGGTVPEVPHGTTVAAPSRSGGRPASRTPSRKRPRRPPTSPRRARSSRRSSTPSWMRSTTCSRRTPRSSSSSMSRKAESRLLTVYEERPA